MLLGGQDLERPAFDVPDLVDVEDHLRLEVAHLGLMRLEQEDRWRVVIIVGQRLVAHRLRHDPRLLCIRRGCRMIDVVGIFQRMGENKTRIELAVDVGQAFHMGLAKTQRIVTGIEEFDLGAERGRGPFRLVLAAGLDLRERHARLSPGKLGLAALAERQANDLDAIAFLGVQRDRTAGAPDEISGMG